MNKHCLLIAAMLLLPGCPVTHEVPAADRALDLAERAISGCPKMAIPPLPQRVTLIVDDQEILRVDGDKYRATEDGERFLRGYARARQLLR